MKVVSVCLELQIQSPYSFRLVNFELCLQCVRHWSRIPPELALGPLPYNLLQQLIPETFFVANFFFLSFFNVLCCQLHLRMVSFCVPGALGRSVRRQGGRAGEAPPPPTSSSFVYPWWVVGGGGEERSWALLSIPGKYRLLKATMLHVEIYFYYY